MVSGYFTRVARQALDTGPKLYVVTNRYVAPRSPGAAARSPEAPLFADSDSGGINLVAELPSRPSPRQTIRAENMGATAPAPVTGDAQARVVVSPVPAAPIADERDGPTVRQRSGAPYDDPHTTDSAAALGPETRDETHAPFRLEHQTGSDRLMPPTAPAAGRNDVRARTPESADSPSIHVHIGRIDVRAIQPPEPKAAPALRTPLRTPSLEAHLRARDRGNA